MAGPTFVTDDAVRDWLLADGTVAALARDRHHAGLLPDREQLLELLDVPPHLAFALEGLAARDGEAALTTEALDALPFVSLCRGVMLPLSGIGRERARSLLGVDVEPQRGEARLAVVRRFLQRDIGLTAEEKVGLLVGDPFGGSRAGARRDTLLSLAASLQLVTVRELRERLAKVADVAAVVAEGRPVDPPAAPLTSREVTLTLRHLPGAGRLQRALVLRSLLSRMGRAEAYVFARLMLRKGVPGFDVQREQLATLLAERFEADPEAVASAAALTDLPDVARILEREGEDGLRRIRLQPLMPVRPALAGPVADEGVRFPVFFERKYDGIRLLLHKETDGAGNVLCAAFTRQRNDWTELVPGIQAAIRALPARRVILDGELYGLVVGEGRTRPGTVYELNASLMGERRAPISLRYAAFDVLYLDGQDLTGLPFRERRAVVERLVRPLGFLPLPVPVLVSDGQVATSRQDLQRLFQFFRGQGYEGGVAKEMESVYHLGRRDRSWSKMKPEETLDLVLIGAFHSLGAGGARVFGSYLLGARGEKGEIVEVGEVAGVDRERTMAIAEAITTQGLLSGERLERAGASGTKIGAGLVPAIVVTVRFEGVVREMGGGLSLRGPQIVSLRPDKPAGECDPARVVEELFVRSRLG